jgi:hypothetical protein
MDYTDQTDLPISEGEIGMVEEKKGREGGGKERGEGREQ